MGFIDVRNVRKEFRIFHHREGVWGAFQDLFHRDYRTLAAVDGISFSVEKGEFVGYIGPNGAGKSTTIKMMTGILVPTSGEILAGGFRPYQDRTRYTQSIGVVFGQRTQLWWDIAVVESLRLLQRIYDVPEADFRRRLDVFDGMLGIGELLHQPVRKLSLGQRMRCDIAAALLHSPKILFLDEPTIGLDIVAKDQIRQFLREINRELRTTIILTTHDLSDIEELCRRVMIIDRGRLLYDGPLDGLRQRLGRYNVIKIHMQERAQGAGLDKALGQGSGISVEHSDELTWRILYNREHISSAEIIRRIVNEVPVRDIYVEEQPIEEIVKTIYSRGIEPQSEDAAAPHAAIADRE